MHTCLPLIFQGVRHLFSLSLGLVAFEMPLTIADVPLPAFAAAGDWNGDGKIDLAIGSTDSRLLLLLQDPLDRTGWRKAPVDSQITFPVVRAADIDGDGHDDILGSHGSVYILRS